MKCLDRNNYDKGACTAYFEAYKGKQTPICKSSKRHSHYHPAQNAKRLGSVVRITLWISECLSSLVDGEP